MGIYKEFVFNSKLIVLIILFSSTLFAYEGFSNPISSFNFSNNNVLTNDFAVYRYGYYSVNGGDWKQFDLNGTVLEGYWLTGEAMASLPEFGKGEHYIVIYSCDYVNETFDCHGNRWQLKIINNTDSILHTHYLSVDYLNNFSAAGDSDYFIVTSNTEWNISSRPSWVNISRTGGFGNGTVTVIAGANTGPQRTGIITLTGYDVSPVSLSLIQYAETPAACVGTPPSTICTTPEGAGTRTVTCVSGNWITSTCIAPLNNTGNIYYISPAGSDTNGNGSISNPWFTLNQAWKHVTEGDTVYLRGGTYKYTSRQYLIGKNGSAGKMIKIWAYPYDSQKPNITRTSTYPTGCYDAVGIFFTGNYVHFMNIEINGFIQPPGNGCVVSGLRSENSNYNIFERLDIHNNGHGMKLVGKSTGNIILNSDFHHNQDPNTVGEVYGNADGLEVGDPIDYGNTNYISGCRFWWNTDDGLDLWDNDGNVTVNNSWAWYNGFIPGTFTEAGDGNGIKLGLSGDSRPNLVLRKVTNCMSFRNSGWGFIDNNAKCNMELYNNIAYQNCYRGYAFGWCGGFHFNLVQGIPYYIKNNIAYGNGEADYIIGTLTNVNHNSWDTAGISVDDADFVSTVPVGIDGPRKPDGSLPDIDFLHLASGSELINKGISVGLPFNGEAPDIGAFEKEVSAPSP